MRILIIINDSNKPLISIPDESPALGDVISLKEEIVRQIEWIGGEFSLQIFVPDFGDYANLTNIGMIEDKCKIKVFSILKIRIKSDSLLPFSMNIHYER